MTLAFVVRALARTSPTRGPSAPQGHVAVLELARERDRARAKHSAAGAEALLAAIVAELAVEGASDEIARLRRLAY